jgi:hypothetical protein
MARQRSIKSAFWGAYAPSVGGGRRKEAFSGRRRPTIGRRPLEAEFIPRPRPTIGQRHPRRLKSASQGAPRQTSASADAKPLPGRRRLSRRLKSAFWGAYAPSVGLRRRRRHFFGHRRPTAGRRPLEAEFIRRAGRPSAEGPWRPNSFGAKSISTYDRASARASSSTSIPRRTSSGSAWAPMWPMRNTFPASGPRLPPTPIPRARRRRSSSGQDRSSGT